MGVIIFCRYSKAQEKILSLNHRTRHTCPFSIWATIIVSGLINDTVDCWVSPLPKGKWIKLSSCNWEKKVLLFFFLFYQRRTGQFLNFPCEGRERSTKEEKQVAELRSVGPGWLSLLNLPTAFSPGTQRETIPRSSLTVSWPLLYRF